MLVRVAGALQTRVAEPIGPPRASARYRAQELRQRLRGNVSVRELAGPDRGLEIERMELPVGARMTGVPHMQLTAAGPAPD